jgi:hypothetical protein
VTACRPQFSEKEFEMKFSFPAPTASLALSFVVPFLPLGRSGYAATAASGIQVKPTRSASSTGVIFLRATQMVVLGNVGHFISVTTPALLGMLAATAAQPS